MPRKRGQIITPREAKAAALYVQGHSKSDAIRIAFNKGGNASPEMLSKRAYKVFSKPTVLLRIQELMEASKISDILHSNRLTRKVADAFELAVDERNLTAAAAFSRQLAQISGALQNHVHIHTAEQRMSDEELIRHLARDDQTLAEQLRAAIAQDTFDTKH